MWFLQKAWAVEHPKRGPKSVQDRPKRDLKRFLEAIKIIDLLVFFLTQNESENDAKNNSLMD